MPTPTETETMSPIPTLPRTLYYYTDARGLKGILNPSRWPVDVEDENYAFNNAAHLMASDVRYMNDYLELRFGSNLANSCFREAGKDPFIKSAMRFAFRDTASSFTGGWTGDPSWSLRCFAACFCSDGDLLSQWRGYSGGTGGFAIGFDSEALSSALTVSSGPACTAADPGYGRRSSALALTRLMPIAYGHEAGGQKVEALIKEFAAVERADTLREDRMGRSVDDLLVAAFEAIASIKHGAFAAESEWRLLTVQNTAEYVRTRVRSQGLVPYVDFLINSGLDIGEWSAKIDVPVASNSPTGPAVREIVVGPSPDQKLQVEAVRDLLRERHNSWEFHVGVRSSTVPFRG